MRSGVNDDLKTDGRARQVIVKYTQFCRYVYRRTSRTWAIGFDTPIGKEDLPYYFEGISDAKALELLDEQIENIELLIKGTITDVLLSQGEYEALISYIHTITPNKWRYNNYIRTLIEQRRKRDVAYDLTKRVFKLSWNPYMEKWLNTFDPQLAERRIAERELFRDGVVLKNTRPNKDWKKVKDGYLAKRHANTYDRRGYVFVPFEQDREQFTEEYNGTEEHGDGSGGD